MFKVPLALILPLVLTACLRLPASTIQVAESSLIRISGLQDEHAVTCSGFVIAPKRVLTANHCVEDITNLTYDGSKDAHVIFMDNYYDLALVEVNTSKPALVLDDDEVWEGQSLTAIGYAKGWNHLLALEEIVRIPNYPVEHSTPSGIILQGGIIGGMSGGPIINRSGRVVSICQRASEFMGYGVPIVTIKSFLRDAEGHRESLLGLGLEKISSKAKVTLAVTPRFSLNIPMTIRATIHTDPDETARGLCLVWDSDIGEAGSHCFPHEGEGAPKTTTWDLLIHSYGEYDIQAVLVRVSDVIRSMTQRVVVQTP